MLWTRLLTVALLAFVVGFPALAQEETEDATPPSTEDSQTEAPPPDAAGPTEEATPQPAGPAPVPAQPTPRPGAAATPVPGPGTVVFSDNFDDLTRPNFPLTPRDPGTRSQGYVDGQYEIGDGNPTGGVSELVPGTYADSTITVDVRLTGGPLTAHAYLACRRVGANTGYQFNVLPSRTPPNPVLVGGVRYAGPRFQLVKLRDGPDVRLIDQGPSDVIGDKGDLIHMELTCAGSTITGSVNGTELFSVLDSTYTSGRHRFGLSGNGSTARFDNLVVTLR